HRRLANWFVPRSDGSLVCQASGFAHRANAPAKSLTLLNFYVQRGLKTAPSAESRLPHSTGVRDSQHDDRQAFRTVCRIHCAERAARADGLAQKAEDKAER